MPDDFNAGPNDVWKDDDAFRNLANKPGLTLNKLSWHCASLGCSDCDGIIRYKFKKFSHTEFNAKTGQANDIWEDFTWDYNHASVQIEGGDIQTPQNTPEGSKCQCFCHRSKKYKDMVTGERTITAENAPSPSPKSIGRMIISQYDQDEIAPEKREEWK
jgi:hypothetical protein